MVYNAVVMRIVHISQSLGTTMYKTSILLLIALSAAQCYRKDRQYWLDLAENELEEALQQKWNEGVAKNVILFIGDGMGPNTVTAARINKGGESHRLSFEKFPHMGLVKTYSAEKMVPDSSTSATALLNGIKVNHSTLGVDGNVTLRDCEKSLQPEHRLKSIAALALEAGKSAGFVTTMRVTHSTPAPLYAHSADRRWECDSAMPADSQCKDMARQLVEDWPGKDFKVIIGGGRSALSANAVGTDEDPINAWSCFRLDGRDLIQTYIEDKQSRNAKYSVVSNSGELRNLDFDNTDYLLGIFANGHLKYDHERNDDRHPPLPELVEAAIKVLQKNENGYFLMVESGNIDMAHHRGRAKKAILETEVFDSAIELAMKITNAEDTLVVVTSDHASALSINGYPDRGASIFGIAGVSRHDGLNFTTLAYGTGGPGSSHFEVKLDAINMPYVTRRDPSHDDLESSYYEQISGITLDESGHGGSDVAVYASGPYSHLFHNVHEQHYIYHAMAYTAKIGPYSRSPMYRYRRNNNN